MAKGKAALAIEQRHKEFEEWISDAPMQHDIDRYPDSMGAPWAGSYKTYTVQLAWLAWNAAILKLKKRMCNRN